MRQSAVSVVFCVCIVTLAATALLAQYFSLFYIYLWLDIPMHFFGGLVVAFGYWCARERWPSLPADLLATLAAVLAVSIGWEVFEYVFRATGGPLDTAKDLVMDLAGGIIGHLAARRIASLS